MHSLVVHTLLRSVLPLLHCMGVQVQVLMQQVHMITLGNRVEGAYLDSDFRCFFVLDSDPGGTKALSRVCCLGEPGGSVTRKVGSAILHNLQTNHGP